MNYITNYYKNLSEQLQEKVNVLQYKLQYLNERAPPPGSFDEIDNIYQEIERLAVNLTAKSARNKVWIPDFLQKFRNYHQQLRALGHGGGGLGDLPLEFFRMLLHGENFISYNGRLLNISRDGKFLLEKLPNGEIVIVKNIDDSPWGRFENGSSTIWTDSVRLGTGPKRPIFGGGWGEFGPAVVAPFFLDRDINDTPGGFRVDQEPPDSATPTSPQSPAGTPVRHWSQDFHP
jgi:hypothetical protein